MRLHQAGVHAADAHRLDVQFAADRQDAGVDEAVEHHGGDIDRFLVGHAPALHHPGLHTHGLGDLGQLRTATVHHHHAHAHVVQDADLFHERLRQCGRAEDAATGLDHKGLALVHADVGRGALQRANGGRMIGRVRDHCGSPLSIR